MSDGLNVINNNIGRVMDNIGVVNKNIQVLGNQIDGVVKTVEAVGGKTCEIEGKLDELVAEFKAFIKADALLKNLQLAETKIIQVRQELDSKFGQNKVIRKNATGLLQGIDAKIIRKETIVSNTEELMLNTPGYWLAPALVALSGWVCDNQQLAERAVDEAMRRDDEKTSLFFALVNRRVGRYDASEQWLRRYIEMQDPKALPQDMIVVLDAFANGLFEKGSINECYDKINEWIKELSEQSGFVEKQRENWKNILKLKVTNKDLSSYVYLTKHAKNFDELKQAMSNSSIHENLFNYFNAIFTGEIMAAKSAAVALDELLDKLVSEYDSEELPLKLEEERLNSIIKEQGDESKAEAAFDVKKQSLTGFVDFTGLLTNAAMFAEQTKSSKATQRLAIALSKDWIIESYKDIVAELRMTLPSKIDFVIDDWNGSTIDGSNEEELIKDYIEQLVEKEKEEIEGVKLSGSSYFKIGAAVVLPFINPILIVGTAGLAYWFYKDYKNLDILRSKVVEKYKNVKEKGSTLIKALMAEVVDYRRAYDIEDNKYDKTEEFLKNINPDQFIYNKYSTARTII